MKVKILNEGIYNGVRDSIVDTKNSLNSCKYVSIDCPSSFKYSGEVSRIQSDIQDIVNDLRNINDSLYSIDSKYRNFISEKNVTIRRVSNCSLKNRIGL